MQFCDLVFSCHSGSFTIPTLCPRVCSNLEQRFNDLQFISVMISAMESYRSGAWNLQVTLSVGATGCEVKRSIEISIPYFHICPTLCSLSHHCRVSFLGREVYRCRVVLTFNFDVGSSCYKSLRKKGNQGSHGRGGIETFQDRLAVIRLWAVSRRVYRGSPVRLRDFH